MIEITSASNPQIKLAAKLQRRRHRHSLRLCLLEGTRLVQDALTVGAAFRTCFITAAAADAQPDLAVQLQQACPVHLVAPNILDKISDTVSPQRIVAVVPMPELPLPSAVALSLILDGVQDPGNAGTLLRTAAAAGAGQVLFAPGCVDPFNGKVMRAAMGAHFRVPIRILADWEEVWVALPTGQPLYLASAEGSILYDEVEWGESAALVLGSEAHGASSQIREKAETVAVPMAAATESLNVAAAGAVILFEAARQRRNARFLQSP